MTPDGIIRWYYATRDDMGAPAFDLVKSRGTVYAPMCGSTIRSRREPCPSTTRHCTNGGVWVCGSCGAPWQWWVREQLRGEVQESKRAADGKYDRWVDVGVQLQRFLDDPVWHWESRVYVANANGYSIRWLVKYGPTEFPAAPFQWKRWKVGELIQAGRDEWTRLLANAGIEFSHPLAPGDTCKALAGTNG